MKKKENSVLPQMQAQSALEARIASVEARRANGGETPMPQEAQDPMLTKLLRAGVDARTAYAVLHLEETLREVAARAEKRARARVLRELSARGARPLENGTSGRAPATMREPLPSEWSREERERVGRAALSGKKHVIKN